MFLVNIFYRVWYGPPQEAIGPKGSIASQLGSILEFLRKPIATCDFSGGVLIPCLPLDPPMYVDLWLNVSLSEDNWPQGYKT